MFHPEMFPIRCTIMRAGTSKGVFIKENELPVDPDLRRKMILGIFGSPDIRQIDGLGGADVLTSKLAIVGPSSRSDADVNYTFGQVSMTDSFVDLKGNCGNISAGVGPFAIDEGMVKVEEPITKVRIHLTNSGNILTAEVPVVKGKAAVEGELAIDGCPGTGARIVLDWSDTAGAFTGSLLPTGSPKDVITVDGKGYEVSLVDCANPLVFIRAESLGIKGTESPAEIEGNARLMELIEKIRSQAAVLFGLIKRAEDATSQSPYNPFFSIVSPAASYDTFNGKHVKTEDIDIVSRLLFMQRMHKTHPGTGTVCMGAASHIPGTIVYDLLRKDARSRLQVKIGHTAGIIPVEVATENTKGGIILTRAAIYRTARRIMDGQAYVKTSTLK